ncbi:hypothetical protein ILYODFUR_002691 [Ilyodon furcidens]|uniref:Uncharacterized protein n=1 Tax=Ilyodon furcidens TaxID=33524 RepID=A0ABV0TRP0_9TELE
MASILRKTRLCGIVSEKERDTNLAKTSQVLLSQQVARKVQVRWQWASRVWLCTLPVRPKRMVCLEENRKALRVRVVILRWRQARRRMDAMPQYQVVQHSTCLDDLAHLPRMI